MFEQLQTLMAEELDIDKNDITLDSHILDDLGADSLDVVELVMALEDTFDISVPDNEVNGLKTVRDVMEFIQAAQS